MSMQVGRPPSRTPALVAVHELQRCRRSHGEREPRGCLRGGHPAGSVARRASGLVCRSARKYFEAPGSPGALFYAHLSAGGGSIISLTYLTQIHAEFNFNTKRNYRAKWCRHWVAVKMTDATPTRLVTIGSAIARRRKSSTKPPLRFG